MNNSSRAYGLTCLLLMMAIAAQATTIVMPTDEQLIAKSPVIVEGTVVSSTPVDRNGVIWTESVVRVSRTIKGTVGETITIAEAGGLLDDRVTMVYGAPEYAAGERVLLFLEGDARGHYRTMDLFVGKFTAGELADGRRLWTRHDEADRVTLLDGDFQPIRARNVQRDAEKFDAFVSDRVAGRAGNANYGVENPVLRKERDIAANFTLIGEPTVYRWFAFENGQTANWYSHGTQPGYTGGGLSEVATALAAWNGYAAAKISYTYAGTMSGAPGGLDARNGTNEILLNDPLNEIAGTWSRSSGGVVGKGGFTGVTSSRTWTPPFAADASHPATEVRAWNITEGNLVIQDGVTPSNGISSSRLAEIISHELGHTLGLGHSPDSGALMYATVTGGGPSLRDDDKLAARWLYPNGDATGPGPQPGQAPAAPSNLAATVSGTAVSLQWSDNATNETSQAVYVASGSASFQKVGDLAANARSTTVNGFSSGTYRLYVTASNASGESAASNVVTVTIAPSPSQPTAFESLVSATAQTSGAGGTSWRTELTVFNAGEGVHVDFIFLPADGSIRTKRVFVGSLQSVTYFDALGELYGLASGAGAIAIRSSSPISTPKLKVSSRTFTSGTIGTYGQGVPDVTWSDLAETLYVPGIQSNGAYRTNVGLVNRTDADVAATLTLRDAAGSTVATASVTVAKNSFRQTSLAALFPSTAGRTYNVLSMTVRAAANNAVSIYASVVDNLSQDPVYIQAVPMTTGNSLMIPAVGRTQGANGTYWRSDVTLFNPSSERRVLSFRFQNITKSLALNGGDTIVLEDVVSQMGVAAGNGALEVSWSGGSGPIATSRTYTTIAGGGGTYGQSIDPVLAFRSEAFVPGLRMTPEYRSNIGLVNGGDAAMRVDVRLVSPFGVELARTSVQLAPKSQSQFSIASLFPGASAFGTFTLHATASTPNLFAYGSMVDNVSGDPVFFAGR